VLCVRPFGSSDVKIDLIAANASLLSTSVPATFCIAGLTVMLILSCVAPFRMHNLHHFDVLAPRVHTTGQRSRESAASDATPWSCQMYDIMGVTSASSEVLTCGRRSRFVRSDHEIDLTPVNFLPVFLAACLLEYVA
jgi:hypothetical protein